MESGEQSLKTSPSAQDWFSSSILVALKPSAAVCPEAIGWQNLAHSKCRLCETLLQAKLRVVMVSSV